ncbi:SdpI family protein [Saccharothrix coeruleofusca]|uniref:SdpI family protein n=1 Tax=Saccharothrix coeruleofusca TaxID=33919 RepID=UPI001E5E2722|nr:SdpI family protein [Saccharothrix coeruleofusca]MBP2339926.1 putative membrane protein [Saccharothrix coeruleofusca]
MNIVLLVVLVLVGVALVAIGVLGVRGQLRRNRFVGVRTAASLRDDETFALANRVAGVPNLVAGLVALLAGAAVLVNPATAVVVGLVGLVGAVAIAVAGGVQGHRAAEALPEPEKSGCSTCACAGACGVLSRA